MYIVSQNLVIVRVNVFLFVDVESYTHLLVKMALLATTLSHNIAYGPLSGMTLESQVAHEF